MRWQRFFGCLVVAILLAALPDLTQARGFGGGGFHGGGFGGGAMRGPSGRGGPPAAISGSRGFAFGGRRFAFEGRNGMGSFGGRGVHGSFGRGFDRQDHRVFDRHRHLFFGFDFVAFGFPDWWYFDYGYPYYGYPYYDYPDDYAYYDSGPAYDEAFWQDLAKRVQLELARRGYYHGQINGVIDSNSQQAIRAFQKAQGLPVTGLIDPGVLRALRLPVPQIPSHSG